LISNQRSKPYYLKNIIIEDLQSVVDRKGLEEDDTSDCNYNDNNNNNNNNNNSNNTNNYDNNNNNNNNNNNTSNINNNNNNNNNNNSISKTVLSPSKKLQSSKQIINNTTIEEKLEYISMKNKLIEKDKALKLAKEQLKLLEIESYQLQQTIDIETNKKFLKEKYYKEKNMLLKSIEMDSDSDDIQKSLVEHIESLKNEYNQTLNDLNDTNEQLKQSKNNIEDLNTKYSLMKKTLLKIMDQYETLKDSFDDDAPETIEKNSLFCTFDNLIPIPFIYSTTNNNKK